MSPVDPMRVAGTLVGKRGPRPYPQYHRRTLFLRVPTYEWAQVKHGYKDEFRAPSGHHSTMMFAGVETPTPVVAYSVNKAGDHDCRLMVLIHYWTEPLGAISEDSLKAEGHETLGDFRRDWMAKTNRRWAPMSRVGVFRVRPWSIEDHHELGAILLEGLYGEYFDTI